MNVWVVMKADFDVAADAEYTCVDSLWDSPKSAVKYMDSKINEDKFYPYYYISDVMEVQTFDGENQNG